MSEKLIKELEELVDYHLEECKKIGYNPKIFKRMIKKDGVIKAIEILINNSKESYGFKTLRKNDKLKLSMEALILENPQFHRFFDEKLREKAREKLEKCGYPPKEKS